MPTTSELLFQAEALLRAGNLAEAERCCRQALQSDPADPRGCNLLGQIAGTAGRFDLAEASFRQAVARQPDHVEAQSNLGVALQLQGKTSEAVAAYRQAVELAPRNAELYRKLAGALEELGERDEAIISCRRAVELQPDHAPSQNSLGVLLERQDRLDEAVACLRQAVKLQGDFADAYSNLGAALDRQGKHDEARTALERALELQPDAFGTHVNLGLVLERQDRWDEAAACYRRATALNPGDASVHQQYAVVLARQGKLDEAADALRRATRLAPDDAEAHGKLASVLTRCAKLDEARAAVERALELDPDRAESYVDLGLILERQDRLDEAQAALARAVELDAARVSGHVNLALVLERQGKLDEAIASYRRALELDPECAEAHFNLGLALLLTLDFAEGWREYEWRFRCEGAAERHASRPRWNGETIEGRTVLLWDEQGLGDSLQFVRYTGLVKQRGARVIIECRRELAGLLKSCPGVDVVVDRDASFSDFDVHLPLLSVPGVVGTSPDSIPGKVPYLFPDAALVERWKETLGDVPALKVGIAWQGNPANKTDRYRSILLEQFAALEGAAGVRLYSLQKGAGREQLAQWESRLPITDLADEIADFQDTAAIMRNLDLVIVSDSAPAHLAGALGVPAWVALTHVPDWRWMLNRTDSPWYPTMRLYRQSRPGDWREVFERIAADLAALQT